MSDKITLQKIFDLAWNHFIVGDGQPAFDENTGCSYETSDGRKCAVGLALPTPASGEDGYYGTFECVVAAYPHLFDQEINAMKANALNLFQVRLHDGLIDSNTGEWRYTKEERQGRYLQVAKDFNLTVPNH